MYGDFKPKFVKQFANIREQMVAGLNKFHEESLSGEFPTPEYSFNKAVELPTLYGDGGAK
jgi:3-methyl-2-oxobutanoate hydroxymethyltransferase